MTKRTTPPQDSWALRPLGNELAEALRAELTGWPDVTARAVMGSLAFFRGKHMLGCYVSRELVKKPVKPEWVNRPGEPPFVWVRLRPEDTLRALRRSGVCEVRLGFAGWVEVALESRASLEEAVRWFGRAYEHPPRTARPRTKSVRNKKRDKPGRR